MDLSTTQQVLMWSFLIALVMGAVVYRTNFCTMGAVSDWVNMGDTGRLRAWVFAIAVAIAGSLALQLGGAIDLSMTASGSSSFPPYRTAMFAWPRYILGGILFGIGMTLGSGCSQRTMVRVGGGNLKSIVVLVMMAIGAYLMMYTNFFGVVFLSWMQPLFVNLGSLGADGQSLGAIIGTLGLGSAMTLNYIIGAVLAAALLAWCFKAVEFRGRFDNILGGGVVGLAVVGAWFVTSGPLGKRWMEDAAFAMQPPLHTGAQSYTFVSPTGDLLHWLNSSFAGHLVSFGLMAMAGVIGGALVYSVVTRKFRLEWFQSFGDAARHVIGGLLMGIGGVLAMGCTIGQGVTGFSTLALGSIIAFASIVFGAALTMKVQYYKMLYEEAGFGAALVTSLVDMHLLPKGLRRLEAL